MKTNRPVYEAWRKSSSKTDVAWVVRETPKQVVKERMEVVRARVKALAELREAKELDATLEEDLSLGTAPKIRGRCSVILIDYSQVAIGNLHQQLKLSGSSIEPNLLRHMVLNSVRKIHRNFRGEYGKIVICADGSGYWRKSVFPHYKAGRKKT